MRNGSKTDDGFVIVSFRRGTGAYKITPEQYEFIRKRFCREYWTAVLTTIPMGGLGLLWYVGHLATHWAGLAAIIYLAGNTALSIARFQAIAHVKRFAAPSSVPVEFLGISDFRAALLAALLKVWREGSSAQLLKGVWLTGFLFFSSAIILATRLLGLENDGPSHKLHPIVLLFFTVVSFALFAAFLKERRRRKKTAEPAQP